MRLALKVVMQNGGYFVDVILLRTGHKLLIRNHHTFWNINYQTSFKDRQTALGPPKNLKCWHVRRVVIAVQGKISEKFTPPPKEMF